MNVQYLNTPENFLWNWLCTSAFVTCQAELCPNVSVHIGPLTRNACIVCCPMDPKDIRTLKILEKVEQERLPSQRDLARELNISLGLVNSFVKRLAKKGYFKITHIPRNRIKYILTPKGAAEKTRLTYDYIQLSYEFYKDARRKLQKIFVELQKQGLHQIIFYGANDLAEIAYVSLQETDIELMAVVDDLKVGKTFLGFKIQEPAKLPELPFDRILITAVNSREIILGKLAARGIAHHLITEIQ